MLVATNFRVLRLRTLLLVTLLAVSTAWGGSLRMSARDSFVPGLPVLVRLEVVDEYGRLDTDVWDAVAHLEIEGATPTEADVVMRNGVGSIRLVFDDADDLVVVSADLDSWTTSRTMANWQDSLANAPIYDGELGPGVTEWRGIVKVARDVVVPVGATLRIGEGAMVLMKGVPSGTNGSDLVVEGRLECFGTFDRPVTITAANPEAPWGEIYHAAPDTSFYQHTILSGGGHSPPASHTYTGPTIRVSPGTRIVFDDVSITDLAGKVMQAHGADLEFLNCHLARAVMGPEIVTSQLLFDESSIVEMYGENDNDGLYLQRPGESLVSRSVIASGDDDGIDLNRRVIAGAAPAQTVSVIVEKCIVRDFQDKAMSIYRRDATIRDCLFVGNGIGVSLMTNVDTDTTRVEIEGTTILAPPPSLERPRPIGIRSFYESEAVNAVNEFHVTGSIVRASDPVRNLWPEFPERIQISYSDVGSDLGWGRAWEGLGNIDVDPGFSLEATDYSLAPGSPCIDAGDPSAPLDDDGTRADQGARPFHREVCELDAVVDGAPHEIERGEVLGFDVLAFNDCESPRRFDAAVLEVIDALERGLYDGSAIEIDAGTQLGTGITLPVPAGATPGIYTLCLGVDLAGRRIDTDCFQVRVE